MLTVCPAVPGEATKDTQFVPWPVMLVMLTPFITILVMSFPPQPNGTLVRVTMFPPAAGPKTCESVCVAVQA